jgi:6-phosphogluconolactonase (cycloisomerase 2 family)
LVTNANGMVGGGAVSSVAVSCKTWTPRFAYVANRGDFVGTPGYANSSISGFAISAAAGQIGAWSPLAGSPFVGAGSNSGSVAIASDPQGRFLFVHNTGSRSISVYAVDALSGGLTPVPGSPYTAMGSLSPKMLVDPTGTSLIVGINPDNDIGLVTQVFSINQTDGSLSQPVTTEITRSVGDIPLRIAMDPSGSLLFVGSLIISFNGQSCYLGELSVLSLDRSTGQVSEVAGSPYLMPNLPGYLVASPVSHYLYATNADVSPAQSPSCPASTSKGTAGYSYDSSSGALTAINGSPFDAASDSALMTIDPTGAHAYLYSSVGIRPYAIDANSGVLNASGTVTPLSGGNGSSILMDQSGAYVFETEPSAQSGLFGQTGQPGQVFGFAVDFNSGALTPLPGSPFATGVWPTSVAIIGGYQ